MKMVQRMFQIRTCRIEIDGNLPRPCLYFDMHACLGPCVASLTTKAAYAEAVRDVLLFLSGRNDELALALAVEDGGRRRGRGLRDGGGVPRLPPDGRGARAEAAGPVRSRARTSTSSAISPTAGTSPSSVLHVRGGSVLDTREFFWEGIGDVDPEEFWVALLSQYYDATTFLPREVHLPDEVPEEALAPVEAWLSERRGSRVEVRTPKRGAAFDRVRIARDNARTSHVRRFKTVREAGEKATLALAKALDLDHRPARIECFDISHLQGSETYASCVVFVDGKPAKGEYRVFRIDRPVPDDFASIAEAVTRRYERRRAGGRGVPRPPRHRRRKGQLSAALAALDRIGIELPAVGLAKREEEVFVPGRSLPVVLPRRHAGLKLLQRARDEAHRFGLKHHRRGADAPDADEPPAGDPGPRAGHGAAAPRRLRKRRGGPRCDAAGARRGRREGGVFANRAGGGLPARTRAGRIPGLWTLRSPGAARSREGRSRRRSSRKFFERPIAPGRTPRFSCRPGERSGASGSTGAGSSRHRRTGRPSSSEICSGRSGSPTSPFCSRLSRGPSRTRAEAWRTPSGTPGRWLPTSPTPASGRSRRRSSTRRSSGAPGRSPSYPSKARRTSPSRSTRRPRRSSSRGFAGFRRSSAPCRRSTRRRGPFSRPTSCCATSTRSSLHEEAEVLDAIDGSKPAADVCLDLRILERLAGGRFRPPSARRPPSPRNRPPPEGSPSSTSRSPARLRARACRKALELHARLVWNTYRRLDWINAYEVLGVPENSQDVDLRQAVHERARLFHPDNVIRATLGDASEALEALFGRCRKQTGPSPARLRGRTTTAR